MNVRSVRYEEERQTAFKRKASRDKLQKANKIQIVSSCHLIADR